MESKVPPCPNCGSRYWVQTGVNRAKCRFCGFELRIRKD